MIRLVLVLVVLVSFHLKNCLCTNLIGGAGANKTGDQQNSDFMKTEANKYLSECGGGGGNLSDEDDSDSRYSSAKRSSGNRRNDRRNDEDSNFGSRYGGGGGGAGGAGGGGGGRGRGRNGGGRQYDDQHSRDYDDERSGGGRNSGRGSNNRRDQYDNSYGGNNGHGRYNDGGNNYGRSNDRRQDDYNSQGSHGSSYGSGSDNYGSRSYGRDDYSSRRYLRTKRSEGDSMDCVSQCVFGYWEVLDDNRSPSESAILKWLQNNMPNDGQRIKIVRDVRRCFSRLSSTATDDGCEFSKSLSKCLNLKIEY